MSLRARIAGVSGIAVAVAVLLGAVFAYVAIRAELRHQVDSALRERAAVVAAPQPDPGRAGIPIGAGGGPGPGNDPDDHAHPRGYREFGRRAPAFGGAAGYLQFVRADGS